MKIYDYYNNQIIYFRIYDHTIDLSAISKCKPNSSIIVMAHNPVMADDIIDYATNHSIIVDLILSGFYH